MSRGVFLSHCQYRGAAGRRPQSLEALRQSRRAVLQRKNACAQRDPRHHRLWFWNALPYLRPMAAPSTYETLGGYGGLRRRRRRSARRHRHPRPSVYRELAVDRGRLSPLLPFKPDARAGEAGRKLSAREAEGHVHDVLNVFMCTGFERASHRYFMKASPVRPGDFIRVLRRNRSHRRAVGLPRRGLRREPFKRCGALLSAQGRDLPPARRGPGKLAFARGQRLLRPARRRVTLPSRSATAIAPAPCGPRSPDHEAERSCGGRR